MPINPKYEYEDQDVNKLLGLKIQQSDLQNVYYLPPIDNVSDSDVLDNNQLVIHLRDDTTRYTHQRSLLVPYNLDGNHWVGIVIHYQDQNNVVRIDYVDSLAGRIPESILRNLRHLFGQDVDIQLVQGFIQQDATSCGAIMIENMLHIANQDIARSVCSQQEIIGIRLRHQQLLDTWAPEINFGYRQEHNVRSFSYEAEICAIKELDISEQDEQILQEDQEKIIEMITLCDQILEDCSSNPALLGHQAIENALHIQSRLASGEPDYYEEAFNYDSGQSEKKKSIFSDNYEEGFNDESCDDEMVNDYLRKTLGIETPQTRRIVDTRSTLANLRTICQLSEKISWTIKNNSKNKNIPWHHLEYFGEILVTITKHYEASNDMRQYVIIDIIQDQEHGLRSLREALNNILQNSQNETPTANLIKKFAGFFYDLEAVEDFEKRLQSLSQTTLSDKVKILSRLRLLQISGEHLKRSTFAEADGKIVLYDARDKLCKLGIEELSKLLELLHDPSKTHFLGFDISDTQTKFQKKFDSSNKKTSSIIAQGNNSEELWQRIKALEIDTIQKDTKTEAKVTQTSNQAKKTDKKTSVITTKTNKEKLIDELVDKMLPYPNQDDGLDMIPKIQDQLKKILRDVGNNENLLEV